MQQPTAYVPTANSNPTTAKDLSVYIHIPFCKKKCDYCDFLSFAEGDRFFSQYCDALTEEIETAADRYGAYTVCTVFIGGGTPSLLPARAIDRVLATVFRCYTAAKGAEITVEANPESADYDKLAAYRQSGVNRVSFGAQSLDNQILERIGRIHSAERLTESYYNARRAGFRNINLDFMYGLPGQRLHQFEDTLRRAAALAPEHLSCYGLIVSDETPLGKQKNPALPNEDEEIEQYFFMQRFLKNAGYEQYEISNYAKQGYASVHNLGYWSNRPYVGFGLGAHSYIDNRRFHNTTVLQDYLNRDFAPKDMERLTRSDRYAEYLFLGLRKTAGIRAADFMDTFGVSVDAVYGDVIKKHVAGGLLETAHGWIRLTEQGVCLSNRVFVDFLP